jgi:hypothetical protein
MRWDVASGTNWAALNGHQQTVRHLAWRPDGRAMASAGDDNVPLRDRA